MSRLDDANNACGPDIMGAKKDPGNKENKERHLATLELETGALPAAQDALPSLILRLSRQLHGTDVALPTREGAAAVFAAIPWSIHSRGAALAAESGERAESESYGEAVNV